MDLDHKAQLRAIGSNVQSIGKQLDDPFGELTAEELERLSKALLISSATLDVFATLLKAEKK